MHSHSYFYSYLYFDELKDKPAVVYMWTPIFIAAVFAFLISHSFISVYEVIVTCNPVTRDV